MKLFHFSLKRKNKNRIKGKLNVILKFTKNDKPKNNQPPLELANK